MSAPIVTRLARSDATLLRELRLEALTTEPAYFSADPDYEIALTQAQWEESLEARYWLVARVDGEIAGLCAFSRITHTKKQAHIGSLGSMYVRAAFRGKGVADALLEAVLDLAETCVEQVSLTVNAENPRAIRFYERHGFRRYGLVPRSLNIDGRFYDDVEMIRTVSASD